ncbi:MAG: aminopeptidase P family protein [Candidatus Aerophobetes bacterium]|nr:aminopeptidase P family protein [Candidatus Aerophobetes bacterium]
MSNNLTDFRLNRISKEMEKKRVDALLITNPYNVLYLTGSSVEGNILFTSQRRFFITTPLFSEEVNNKMPGWEVVIYKDTFEKRLNKLWRELKGKSLGFEDAYLSYKRYKKIKQIPERMIPCSKLLEDLRIVKDKKEISFIKKASQITEQTFRYLESLLHPGLSEKELSIEAVYFIRKKAEEESFPPIILFGERTSLCHGRPGERKLKENELVLMDIGVKVGGYCSDLTRTIFFGDVEEDWQKIYETVVEAQEKGMESIKPGVVSSWIDKVVRGKIKEAGYGNAFVHNTGHGVGLEIHEEPFISPQSKRLLKEGMVFTVEPGIYLEGKGGVRVEKMVVVTKKGGEILG